MSTRACIAIPEGDTWRGRYTHWDGYASHMGRQYWAIVQRDGLEKARRVLVGENYGWSSIYADPAHVDVNDSSYNVVPGYGNAFTDESPDHWITPADLDCFIEWVYILTDAGLMLGVTAAAPELEPHEYEGHDGKTHTTPRYKVAAPMLVRWDGEEPNWDDIEATIYAAAFPEDQETTTSTIAEPTPTIDVPVAIEP